MKRRKRILIACMTAAMLFTTVFSAMTVSAAGLDLAGTVVDGSLLTTDTETEDSTSVLTRGNILMRGTLKLSNLGNRTVGIGGSTTCHVTCDTVICNLYLEQLHADGNWYTYDYWNYSTTNAYSLTKSVQPKVAGGHWYRAVGGHIAIKGTTVESVSTETDGIWID